MQQPRKHLRLLHTADLHMGSDIYPQQAIAGLDAIVNMAQENSVDVVLVAGDLFDASRVSQEIVSYTFDSLGNVGRPVVILPGNHDTLLTGPSDLEWSLPPNVRVLQGNGGNTSAVDGLGLSIWGRPVYEHTPEFKPLEGLQPRPDNGWYVVMAHGLVADGIPTVGRSSLITKEDLQQADCDYIALGHVHRLWNVTNGGPPAFYSGAPSGNRRPTAVIVNLIPSAGVTVEPAKL